MNTRSRIYDMGDDPADSSHDRTLRALEGRFDDDDDHAAQMATPTANRRDPFDNDDTGDVFLKIAREESSRRKADDYIPSETQSVVVCCTNFLSFPFPCLGINVSVSCSSAMCWGLGRI